MLSDFRIGWNKFHDLVLKFWNRAYDESVKISRGLHISSVHIFPIWTQGRYISTPLVFEQKSAFEKFLFQTSASSNKEVMTYFRFRHFFSSRLYLIKEDREQRIVPIFVFLKKRPRLWYQISALIIIAKFYRLKHEICSTYVRLELSDYTKYSDVHFLIFWNDWMERFICIMKSSTKFL